MHHTCHAAPFHTRAVILIALAVLFCLSGSMMPPAHAESSESHGFYSALATPPALATADARTDEQPDCTIPDNARAHPLVCSADAQKGPTRSASAKSGYLDNHDTLYTPHPDHIGNTRDKPFSGANESESSWEVEVEFRESAVVEETGNAKRNDSIGGLIKGNMKF